MISLRLQWTGLALFTATVLIATWAIIQSPFFKQHPDLLAFASTIDIVVVVPLVYMLLIRPTTVPAITVVPVFALCAIAASLIIPGENHRTLEIIGVGGELTIITILASQALKIRKRYRLLRGRSFDFYDSLRESLRHTIPYERVTQIILTEVSLFYYSTAGWFSKTNEQVSFPQFTTYKESGYPLLASVIVTLLCLETTLVHFFLLKWSPVTAWILTGLSVYSLFFLFGDLNSLRRRPILIQEGGIGLRVGIRWNTLIPFKDIREVEATRIVPPIGGSLLNAALLHDANCIIRLTEPAEVFGMYGIRKTVTSIALSIDDLQRFLAEMRKSMKEARGDNDQESSTDHVAFD